MRSSTTALMSSGSGQTGGSAEKSEKARMRRSSDSISSTTMLAAWLEEGFGLGAVIAAADDHLLNGEADGGEGVLDLVRGFAGQHLPAGELGQVDEAVAVLFEVRGGVVERGGGVADLVVRNQMLDERQAHREVAGGELAEAAGEVADGARDAAGDVDQDQQRRDPDERGGEGQGEAEATEEIAGTGVIDGLPGGVVLAGELGEVELQRRGVDGYSGGLAAQEREVVGAADEALGRCAIPELAGFGVELRGSYTRRADAARCGVIAQTLARQAVVFVAGVLKGAGGGVQFGDRGDIEAAFQ